MVRVQVKEGQNGRESGLFEFVRHPGLFGACLQPLGAGMILG